MSATAAKPRARWEHEHDTETRAIEAEKASTP
jgi:hypothetical protein